MSARRQTVVLFGLFIILLVTGAIIVSAQDPDLVRGEPEIDAYAPETAFVPGEEATLEITLNNPGNIISRGDNQLENDVITAQSTTAKIVEEEIPLEVRTNEQPIGDVGEGPTGPIEFTIVPNETAEPGIYEIPIELSYRHAYRAEFDDGAVFYSERDETETVFVEIEITDQARFAVVDVNGTTQAGAPGTVDITVRNVGNESARDVSVVGNAVDPDLTFTTEAGATDSYIDEWGQDDEVVITYGLTVDADATVRPLTFELDFQFHDGDGADASARTVRTGVTPLPDQSFSADGVNSTLYVGQDGTFTANITNDGPRDITSAIIIFDNEAPAIEEFGTDPLPTDPNVVPRETQVTVGDLAVGESTTVTFDAGIRDDARPGDRTLNIVSRYRTQDGDLVLSDVLDVVVPVGEERDAFAVTPTNPMVVEPGGTITYNATVQNTAGEHLTDIQAKLYTNDPLESDDDETFIPALAPNETTTITFEIDIDSSASLKTYGPSIDFRYTDESGDDKLSDTYRIPLEVATDDEEALLGIVPPSFAVLVLGTLIAVASAVGYRRRESIQDRFTRIVDSYRSWMD